MEGSDGTDEALDDHSHEARRGLPLRIGESIRSTGKRRKSCVQPYHRRPPHHPFHMEIALKELLLSVMALALCSSAAWAQRTDTSEFDGRWTAVVQGDQVGARTAQVTIGDYAGTWLETGGRNQKKHACQSRKPFPITVQQSNKEEVEFMVWAAMVLPACADFSVRMKPVDEKTLEGTVADGLVIRMTRRK